MNAKRRMLRTLSIAVAAIFSQQTMFHGANCYGFQNGLQDATWLGLDGNWSDSTMWDVDPSVPNNGNDGKDWRVFIDAGTIDINQLVRISELNFSGGELTGANDLIVDGDFNWTGGGMQGSGKTILAGNSIANLGSSNPRLSREIVNQGTFSFQTGSIGSEAGARITNAAGANFQFQGDGQSLYDANSIGVFENQAGAVLSKISGTGQSNIGWHVNNQGTVEVATGQLILSGGGDWSGTANIADGATLQLTGSWNAEDGGSISGLGQTILGNPESTGAAISFGQTADQQFRFQTKTEFAAGEILGSGDVVFENDFNWTGGGMQGSGKTILAGNSIANLGSSNPRLSREIVNQGTFSFQTGSIGSEAGARITNAAGANFQFQGDGQSLYDANSIGVFENQTGAVLSKVSGTGQSNIGWHVNNQGTVEVATGQLILSGGGDWSGTANIADGATLQLTGSWNAEDGGSISGLGQTILGNPESTGAAISFGQTADQQFRFQTKTEFAAGEILGSGDAVFENDFNWTGGGMQGSGKTILAGNSIANLGSSNPRLSREIVNQGTFSFQTGSIGSEEGARITNTAGTTSNSKATDNRYTTPAR